MSADAKSVVRRLYEEVWKKRRLEVVNELMSPSHALQDPHLSGTGVGPEAYKRVVIQFLGAFPDLRFTINDMVSEKDKVAVSWTISGTQKREFRGIPASNKEVSLEGITINHVANGKIIDSYASIDYLGMMQQIGVAPVLESAKSVAAGVWSSKGNLL
jgi:steroid delta-isomerase-like uncharacterized protein